VCYGREPGGAALWTTFVIIFYFPLEASLLVFEVKTKKDDS